MQRAALLLSAVGLLFAATEVSAQDKPNFAGKWTLVADQGGGGGGGGGRGGGRGGLGAEATIAQDASTLTITRATQAGETKAVYKLDGSESKNTMTMRGGTVEQTSKARWEGSKLIITTSMMMGENAVETTMALSLGADGVLVVESTGAGRGGGAPTTTTRRYTKS
jgi:hypothetical protein